jgi:hypothetical protein
MVMGLNPDLDEAMKIAMRETIDFITGKFPHLTREEAYIIASVAVDYHVTQVVDVTAGIHGRSQNPSPSSSRAKRSSCWHFTDIPMALVAAFPSQHHPGKIAINVAAATISKGRFRWIDVGLERSP